MIPLVWEEPGIVIIDTHNVGVSPLQGNYSAYLFGGNSPVGPTSTTISQTGLVPNGAQAISVDAYAWNGFTLSLNGQTIIDTVGAGVLSGVYSGNISAFAGQTVQLSITVPSSPYMDVNPTGLLIDDIEISTIPEPSVLGLAALGAWLLGWRVLACPWKPAPISSQDHDRFLMMAPGRGVASGGLRYGVRAHPPDAGLGQRQAFPGCDPGSFPYGCAAGETRRKKREDCPPTELVTVTTSLASAAGMSSSVLQPVESGRGFQSTL